MAFMINWQLNNERSSVPDLFVVVEASYVLGIYCTFYTFHVEKHVQGQL